jgi:uncharacterized membrane protein YiaA
LPLPFQFVVQNAIFVISRVQLIFQHANLTGHFLAVKIIASFSAASAQASQRNQRRNHPQRVMCEASKAVGQGRGSHQWFQPR